jgi:hypothetical protein
VAIQAMFNGPETSRQPERSSGLPRAVDPLNGVFVRVGATVRAILSHRFTPRQASSMQIDDLEDQMQFLVGEQVVAKSLIGNSITLWFVAEPKNAQTKCIWIDSPWRIETQTGIESTSYGFPEDREDGETKAEHSARFEKCCAQSDCLKDAKLIALAIEECATGGKKDGRIVSCVRKTARFSV